MKFGKWIGGGLGWAFGGPIGALIGFGIGSLIDGASYDVVYQEGHQSARSTPSDFKVSLLVLMAIVMKADKKLLSSELDYVKRFLVRQYGEREAKEQLIAFRDILKKEIPVRDVCLQIKHFLPHASRLEMLHLLFGLAQSDGNIDQTEEDQIHIISNYLGINQYDYESIKAMFVKGGAADYKILEIDENATDEEVKKAYKKMAMKYHPDRVADAGEAIQKAAKEKFQSLQQAYENIKKKRGFN